MKCKKWRQTEKENQAISYAKLDAGIFKANQGKTWANCHVVKNFKEEIQVGQK